MSENPTTEEETANRLVYFALVGLNLLSAEEFPPESLQLIHSVLAGLSVGAHDAVAQLIWTKNHL